jgi:hypothetical protein
MCFLSDRGYSNKSVSFDDEKMEIQKRICRAIPEDMKQKCPRLA